MLETKKVSYLIVDASGFMRCTSLQDIADNIYTVKEVIKEIKDKNTRERLSFLPYEIHYKEPSVDGLKFVTEFSKKTGDYPSLSATDLKILAITYDLHKEHIGLDSINCEPSYINIESAKKQNNNSTVLVGFYEPIKQIDKGMDLENKLNVLNINDDNGWITPSINKKTLELSQNVCSVIHASGKVGCLTLDFAMQNVVIQMKMKVIGLDGYIIQECHTFLLRCIACFKITSDMERKFCRHCGNNTLKKVVVRLQENGQMHIHIPSHKKLNLRGTKFSLPMPRGGKHANNPILCEDQPVPQNRLSKLEKQKLNPLDPDYINESSPFAEHDLYSPCSNFHHIHNKQSWKLCHINQVRMKSKKSK